MSRISKLINSVKIYNLCKHCDHFSSGGCTADDVNCKEEIEKQIVSEIRADAIKEYKQSDEYIKECVQRYLKGKADKYQEITSAYMLLTEKQVEDISAEAIEDYKEKSFGLIEKIILENVNDIPTGLNIYAQIMAGMEKLIEVKKEGAEGKWV